MADDVDIAPLAESREPPRRGGRLRRLVVGLALGFLTIYTGVFFELNDRLLGKMISALVTGSVRGTFSLGRAHYDYFGGLWSILTNRPTHVRGGDFEMLDPDGNLVMRVPHVEAEIHLQELIGSLIHFGLSRHFHVRLHFAHVDLPGGYAIIGPTRSSFGGDKPEMNIVATMSGKKPSSDDKGELSIQVDEIELRDIDFALASSNTLGQLSWVGLLEGAHGRASLSYSSAKWKATPEGPAFFFALRDVEVARGQLTLGDFEFPLARLHAYHFGTVPTPGRGTIAPGAPPGYGARQELSFQAEASTFEGRVKVTGALLEPYGSHGGVRLRLELEHGAGLARLLPDPVASWISGDPRGAVNIEGPFTNVAISGELDGAHVELAGLRLDNAGGKMRLLDGGLLRLEGLHADLGRGKVRGKLDVKLAATGSFKAEIDASGVDPASLDPVPASLRGFVAGRFAGKVKLGGGFGQSSRGSAIDIEVSSATLDRDARDPLPRHLELAGTIDVRGERVGMRSVSIHGEGLSLDAHGELAFGKSPRGALDFTLGAGTGGWMARVGLPGDVQLEHAVARGHIAGPLLGLEGRARLELHGLVVQGRRVDRATAELELGGGRLRIGGLSGEGLGAGLAGRGTLRLFEVDADGRTRLDRRAPPEIDAVLHAEGAKLSEVAGTDAVGGRADLEVQLKGPLAHPSGHAAVSVPELTLLGDRYAKGRVAFDFSDEGAKVSALHLERADGGKLDGSGGVSWAGALDLALDPSDFPLAAIPGVSSLPIAILGTLSGKVHLGGELTRPEPGGVISLVGAKIRDTFFGDGSLKLEPGPDAIHITGRFFQNYSVDGYLTLFPKISVAVTVKFADIELEKLFPEMRRLAEVRGKATGQARLTADATAGLTFAELKLSSLNLVLSGLDETGNARRLVVRNEEDVVLSTDGHKLTVGNCQLRSALGAFEITGRISQKDTDVALRGQIGLELLEYFFASFFQKMSGDAVVDLAIKGDLSAKPTLLGSIDLRRAVVQPRGLDAHRLFVPSGFVEFQSDGVILRSLKMELDGAVAQASGRIELAGYVPGAISGEVSGELSPKLLQWVLPDQIDDASGRVAIKVRLAGSWQRPDWRGEAQIKNARVSLRRSGRQVAVNEGSLRFVNYDIAIGCGDSGDRMGCRSISGLVDDESRFSIDGKVGFGENLSLRAITLRADASDLGYNQGDFAVRVSPSLEISGDGRHLSLAGTLNVVEGRFTMPFNLAGLLFTPNRTSERPVPFWEGILVLEQMKLDVRARTTGPFLVRNNIADFTFGADLQLGGTLTSPTVGGSATVDQGGTINLPVCRFPFQTERSQITFDPEKRYPDTPTLNISATGVLVSDRSDATQNINIQVIGPLGSPQLLASTQQGLQGNDVLFMCFTGKTADEVRRGISPATTGQAGRAPAFGQVQGTTTTEGVAKGASGALVASAIDPLRKVAHLDTLSLEFGATGIDIQACKRWTRGLKTCGQGEFGFISGTRVGGFAEYRISDQLSVLGRGEYLTRGVETVQDSLTRGRLELNLRLPLIW